MTRVREALRRRLPISARPTTRAGAVPAVFLIAAALALFGSLLLAQGRATYLYSLASFAGSLRYDSVRIAVDQERDETYVLYQNVIRVYNPSGMEVFSFGDDLALGQILDAVVDGNGDILLLSYKDQRYQVTRCDFRGVPVGAFEIKNLPAGLAFSASRVLRRNGMFYFVSLPTSSVIVTDSSGVFRRHIELDPLLEPEDREKGGGETIGFTVDPEGNVFFTLPTLFRVYRISPDGKLASFGRSGSAPGRFGIVSGITADSHGNLLVADKLKCVVMMFDKDFNFLSEFGYRGTRPENLIQPDDLSVDHRDRLYVSQGRKRGVSVFALAN